MILMIQANLIQRIMMMIKMNDDHDESEDDDDNDVVVMETNKWMLVNMLKIYVNYLILFILM